MSVVLHLPFEVADYVDFYASEHHAAEPRTAVPAGRGAAHAELEAHARRLPRPGRHRGRLRHRHHPSLRAAQGPRAMPRRPSGRVPASTSRPSWASSSASEPRSARRSPSTPSPTTSSAPSWSTTGPPATSRPGSTCRSGPHLGKSFATSVSPWVVPLLALEAARVPLPGQRPAAAALPAREHAMGLDVDLAVAWNGEVVSRPPYREMYWSPAQMLAHMTVNGASTRTGDLFASGTVSGPAKDQHGSLHRAHPGRPGTDHRQRRAADVPARRRRRRADRHRPGCGRRPHRLR